MEIKTNKEASKLLKSVIGALDQLTVQGKKNCYIVVACGADVEAVAAYLDKADAEQPDESEKED